MNYSASVHLVGKRKYVAFHLCDKNLLLDLISMLKELLNDVVAENVLHELQRVLLKLSEDALLDFAVG